LSTAPYADGSPLGSQWPIPPGHFFDYELHPKAHEAGTSFYHSHIGFQAITAAGALVVKDAGAPPYPYDDEIILKLGDYYPYEDHEVEEMLNSKSWRWTGDPTALLLNGHSGTAPGPKNPNPSDESCQPWQVDVEPGKTYRWRLIGGTALSMVVVGFEDHENLTVIETDNSYVLPVETPFIQADTGQRFSFLLKTKTQEELDAMGGKTKFWIQAETREGAATVPAWAILNYVTEGSVKKLQHPADRPSSPSTASNPDFVPQSPILDLPYDVQNFIEYTFQNPDLPGYPKAPTAEEVTRRVTISTLQFLNDSSGYTEFKENMESWHDEHPLGPTTQTPYLVEILSSGTVNTAVPNYERALSNPVQEGFDPVSHTYPARIGEVIEIIWQNAASFPAGIYGPHPLHAHGDHFWDLGSGPGVYSAEAHKVLLESHSVNGRPWSGSRRDTTLLYKYRQQSPIQGEVDGWRVWRLRVTEENVGVWMMHCHILQHMIMGQQIVWVFGTPDEIKKHTQPVEGFLDGYFTYGGDVVGKEGAEGNVKRARFFL
jgi:L-ascorbate oxidase